ncbi:MAG TPA: DUF2892 domain-containing protein [Archaeoglobaceae archaeon]|nr:DUF2892 domain-containing protein [Archaeoglobaceae archaeon]
MSIGDKILEENVGGYDLFLRTVAGTVAIIALAMDVIPFQWEWLVAFIAFTGLFTAITRHCSLYAFTGFSTAKEMRKD